MRSQCGPLASSAFSNRLDVRRLEVVVDEFLLHGGAQLAIDTWCRLSTETALRGIANTNGKALEMARRRKERTHPELAGDGRARLVILGGEVFG